MRTFTHSAFGSNSSICIHFREHIESFTFPHSNCRKTGSAFTRSSLCSWNPSSIRNASLPSRYKLDPHRNYRRERPHPGAARDHKRENSVPTFSNTFTLHPKIECPMDPRQHLPRSAQKSGQAANWWALCHAEARSAIRRLPRSPGICLLSPCTQV